MTDTELFDEVINKSGYKSSYVADYLGISLVTLWKKKNNDSTFNAIEIGRLAILLKLTWEQVRQIFFARIVLDSNN